MKIEESDLEFIINGVVQIVYGFGGFFGNLAMEGFSALFTDSIALSTDITKMEYNKLSGDLISGRLTKTQIKMKLLRIFKQIQKVDG